MILAVDPLLLGLRISTGNEIWSYSMEDERENPESGERTTQKYSGQLTITLGPGNVIYTSGYQTNKEGTKSRLKEATGIRYKDILYLPIGLTDSDYEIAAFGRSSQSRSNLILNVYELSPETKSLHYYYGEMKLYRNWPWLFLGMLFGLPLLIVWIISLIGPILISAAGTLKILPKQFSNFISDIKFKLSGGILAYIVVFILTFIFYHGIPRTLNQQELNAESQCKSLEGEWFFTLSHKYPLVNQYWTDHAGQFRINCGAKNEDISISGILNALYSTRYKSQRGCYTIPQPGEKGQAWSTLAAGITQEKLLFVFFNEAVGQDDRDLGLVNATIQSNELQKWFFYDFRQVGLSKDSVNRGEMYVFRPDSTFVWSCAKLHEKIMDNVKDLRKRRTQQNGT